MRSYPIGRYAAVQEPDKQGTSDWSRFGHLPAGSRGLIDRITAQLLAWRASHGSFDTRRYAMRNRDRYLFG